VDREEQAGGSGEELTARPAIPDPPYHGGCLCGSVRYAITARPLAVYACHCGDCRKLSGGTQVLMALLPVSGLAHEAGEVERYTKRADSGRLSDVVRCKRCGTRLWHEPSAAAQFLVVATGTLDDPSWIVPAAHIWIDKAMPGAAFLPDALLVEGQPANRQMLLDAFARLYPVRSDSPD
jgi:hypothetical protein